MYYKFNKETLDLEKVKTSKYIIQSLGFIIGVSLILGFKSLTKEPINLTQESKLIIIREYNEFSEKKLIDKISQLNFKFPHIVLAQSKLESGNFKSIIFLENNNMFGMKRARLRVNLAKGTNRGHAYYENWQESLYDYSLFYSTYLSDVKTESEYFEYLKQNYAEDPTYIQRLKQIINKQNLKLLF